MNRRPAGRNQAPPRSTRAASGRRRIPSSRASGGKDDRATLGRSILSESGTRRRRAPQKRLRPSLAAVIVIALASATAVWFGSRSGTDRSDPDSLSEAEFVERAVIEFARAMHNDVDAVPVGMIRHIQAEISNLARRDRAALIEVLERTQELLPQVQQILYHHDLPPELAYIAMLESRFDPEARSRAGAVGLWQLMPVTARAYGLKVNSRVDERLDPIKSTHAAARYLKKLYVRYGDFMLVLAAYNYGPANVNYALDQILEDDPLRHRNYWYLVRKNLLPRETDEYVYKVISGWLVATHPRRFGLPERVDLDRGDLG